jgi:glycosyltransferase involved in cell wall biosynthesis
VIALDGDLQHPPAMIPELLRAWRAGSDVVLARRRYSHAAPIAKRLTSGLFYRVFNALSSTRIVPGAADFFLLSHRAHASLRALPERHRFTRGLIAWLGYPTTTVSYDARPRTAGRSKYTAFRMASLAMDAVFAFSPNPLRLASRIGLLMFCLGAAYFVFVLYSALVTGNTVAGWSSLISVVFGLGGLQLLFTGLIGEYLSRLYEEAKGRPLYVLKHVRLDRDAAPVTSDVAAAASAPVAVRRAND